MKQTLEQQNSLVTHKEFDALSRKVNSFNKEFETLELEVKRLNKLVINDKRDYTNKILVLEQRIRQFAVLLNKKR